MRSAQSCRERVGGGEQFEGVGTVAICGITLEILQGRAGGVEEGAAENVERNAGTLGKLMIRIASKGHFFTQIPQPLQAEVRRQMRDSGDGALTCIETQRLWPIWT
jgi:hypothetical protein